ncbi:hypothetical protein J2Z60_000564 [Lactobacillus colini]|uniref:Integral membrane protein n=1 Tax=Lactobacillus colini TaxID=1819254 RepID=A0ABS4MCI8_9LACO|nr:hypothetical protein [Lactobacillus colini]MBP2057400.1 hypothetical protein [Lactobacillus colini]
MKTIKDTKWQRIILTLLSLIDAGLIYYPKYALVSDHTKLNCAVFLILAAVLIWLPTETASSIFAINFFYEIGLVLLLVFFASAVSLNGWLIYVLLILVLLTWLGIILLKNRLVEGQTTRLKLIRLAMMLVFAILAYLSGFIAMLMISPLGFIEYRVLIYLGAGLFVYYLVLAGSIWQKWFKGWISWGMILIAVIFHTIFAFSLSIVVVYIPLVCEVILLILVFSMNLNFKKSK